MVNKVLLIGNLGQDPELRNTPGGQSVATLRLATADRYKDKDGNWQDRTEWHTVVVWGRTAENVAKFCKKGKQIYVEGRLTTRKWQDKEGKDRYSTEIVADTVQFLGGAREGSASEDRGREDRGREDRGRDTGRREAPGADDDGIPF
jgi:single-strand DNA-binding protein